ncbi:hypothetical protein JOB18_005067 [Solea senegalensis]|uniref:Uncharacterized protein n=1 Tax=Solea senegalensis TaxID=28829 RepID=A0AAV6RB03_SOLSE|nr:hypothetical protein JOB18_005067 [Solea senegalensis]
MAGTQTLTQVCCSRANPCLHRQALNLSFHSQRTIQFNHDQRGSKSFRLPVFRKPADFPGQKAEQAAINYKEILSSCRRFVTTPVSKANRYTLFGSLVPCTAAMPNPGPQILLQQITDRHEGRVRYRARSSIIIPILSTLSRLTGKQHAEVVPPHSPIKIARRIINEISDNLSAQRKLPAR